MSKSIIVATLLLLSVRIARAADVEQYESFFGFDFVRFDPHGVLPSFNAEGGDGQLVYNVNSYIGVVADVGAVTKGELNHNSVDTTVVNFMAGPRFKYHGESRFQPFVHMLFGGAYYTASTSVTLPPSLELVSPNISSPTPSESARLVVSRTGFAMLAGGGLDVKLNKHISFRAIGADYYLARLPSSISRFPQNVGNFRYTTGLNILFGPE